MGAAPAGNAALVDLNLSYGPHHPPKRVDSNKVVGTTGGFCSCPLMKVSTVINVTADDGTLQAAQQRVRQVLRSGASEVSVQLAAGDYYNVSLLFTALDSPPPGGSVTWHGPTRGVATIYGGARITGWVPWRDGVWQATLPRGLVDERGRATFRSLVQGERSAWLARTPNYGSGYLQVDTWTNGGFTWAPGALPGGVDCETSSIAPCLGHAFLCVLR